MTAMSTRLLISRPSFVSLVEIGCVDAFPCVWILCELIPRLTRACFTAFALDKESFKFNALEPLLSVCPLSLIFIKLCCFNALAILSICRVDCSVSLLDEVSKYTPLSMYALLDTFSLLISFRIDASSVNTFVSITPPALYLTSLSLSFLYNSVSYLYLFYL